MRKFCLLGLILTALLLPMGRVQAQTAVTMDSLEIDLWPEFDRPEMLVIYRITLAPDVQLPVTMSLHIPTAAGNPFNVAVSESDGMLYNAVYTRTVEGDLAKITFTATTPNIQFEYYDPGLKKNGNDRNFAYTWNGEAAVKALTVQVQQPVGAKQVVITPDLGAGITGEGGLLYCTGMLGSVPAGNKFSLSISYQKATSELSSASMNVQPVATLDTRSPGRIFTDQSMLLTGGVVLGMVLVGGGLWLFFNQNRGNRRAGEHKRHERVVNVDADDDSPIYCFQCGRRASDGDVFCRACGARLRRSG